MADELRTRLIELYARNNACDLQDAGDMFKHAFGSDRETLVGRSDFAELNQTIKEQKEFLELGEQRYQKKHGKPLGDPKAQVIECLKLLLNRALFNKSADVLYKQQMDVLYELMIARYARNPSSWPATYLSHMNFLYPRIRDWHLFFFSYTNEGAEIVNNEYKAMIEHLIENKKLDPVLQNTQSRRDNNLVAEVIVQHLRRNNVQKGFYDKVNIATGDELAEKIRLACSSSFLFIQLVTRDTLTFRDRNWPFEEYREFKKANDQLMAQHEGYHPVLGKRFLFALGGHKLAHIKPQGFLPFEYEDWCDHIDGVKHEALPNDATLFQDAIDKIAATVRSFLEMEWIQAVE